MLVACLVRRPYLLSSVKHQRLKHAAARHSTLKIGVGRFRAKISDQNINPISEQSTASCRQYSGGEMVHLGLRGL